MNSYNFYKHALAYKIINHIILFILFSFHLLFFVQNSYSQYVDEDEDIINRLGFVPKFFHPREEKLDNEMFLNNLMVPEAKGPLQTLAKGKKSLLNYMPYLGPDRHQLNCGNCWAWAATGAMEIMHAVQKNIHDRLSVQYINSTLFSNFNKLNACLGGSTAYFITTCSQNKKLIPWNNQNADYKDGNGGRTCSDNERGSYLCPNVLTNEIQDEPNYPITSLGLLSLKNFNDTTEDIVQKIKYYINKDIPVVMEFCFTAANSFPRFWLDKNEDDVWDMSYIPENPPPYSTYSSDCHAVLITGYNDESENDDENYLEILNSWGTPDNRPQGIFKAKLNMDYNLRFVTGDGYGYNLIHALYVINPNFVNYETNDTGTVVINVIDYLGNPKKNMSIIFNEESYNTDKEGKITIPNVSNQLEYTIKHNYGTQVTIHDNTLNQCITYEYNNNRFTGTFDFSVNKEAEFTFTQDILQTSNPEDYTGNIVFTFKDINGNPLNNVSIHINNETYQTASNSNRYNLGNIHKNTNYNFSFSKEGYIFNEFNYIVTNDNLANSCAPFTNEPIIIGREITDNKAIINVIDEDSNPLENEIIIVNNKEYATNENGTITIENLSDGENYEIKAKTETGGTTINENIYCFNYDNLRGTFDFSESNTVTLTITKHYTNLLEKGSYRIATFFSNEFSNVRFPYVNVEVNGILYKTNKYGLLYIRNINYGTNLVININMEGYYPINFERKFDIEYPDNLNEGHCSASVISDDFNLLSTSYPTYTPTYTRTFTNTLTPTLTLTQTLTFTPTKTKTPTFTPTFTPTKTKTQTPTIPTGYITINFRDISNKGISLENIKVIYNDKETYTSGADGVINIFDVPYNQTFTLKYIKNGYKFSPSTSEGKLNNKNDNFYQVVTVSLDNETNNCKKINLDTKKLKNNATKIYNFSKIDKKSKKKIIEAKFSKISNLLNKLPKSGMACENGKNLTSISFKKIKNNLKNNLKTLYNTSLKINEDFKKKNKKPNKWLNNRKQKLLNFFNNANNEIAKIPDIVYEVK